jgi:hypothetical protein
VQTWTQPLTQKGQSKAISSTAAWEKACRSPKALFEQRPAGLRGRVNAVSQNSMVTCLWDRRGSVGTGLREVREWWLWLMHG